VTFEFTPSSTRKPHSLVFIGGLGDGIATTAYLADVVTALTPTEWSVFTLNLTSSYQSWGLGNIDRDTDEIAQCIQYVKDYKTTKFSNGKIVLMGHSTGSQDVLHYLYRPNPHTGKPAFDPGLQHVKRLAVDGAIMQAPVSDREVIHLLLSFKDGWGDLNQSELRALYDKMVSISKEAEKNGKAGDTLLPLEMTACIYPSNTPITCRRFLSLVSPESPQTPSEDDLFSSDLSDEQLEKTFGMVNERGLLNGKLLALSSGSDQSVPEWVDKEKLLVRWRAATNHGDKYQIWDQDHSGVIPGASHALSNDDQAEPRKDLVRRITGYLYTSEKDRSWRANGNSACAQDLGDDCICRN
jgi:pimeloyl-ACP methyl ester carboxylesterase